MSELKKLVHEFLDNSVPTVDELVAFICSPRLKAAELRADGEQVRNRAYLDDLRHDLQDEEFRFRYLSACAMDSGEALRIGIRDVMNALLSAATPAPTGLKPIYYVKHPDNTYSEADPQPYFDYEAMANNTFANGVPCYRPKRKEKAMANELSRQEADDFAREIAGVFWPNGTTKAQDAIYDNQIEALIPLLQRTVRVKCDMALDEASKIVDNWDWVSNPHNVHHMSAAILAIKTKE